MKVEIYGGNSINKGAYLMVLAVQQALQEHFGDVTVAIDPSERMAVEERAIRNIRYIYSLEPLVRRLRPLLRRVTLQTDRFVSKYQKDVYGLTTRSECDALIDVSGYRYGDFWGARTIRNFTALAAYYHKRGKPVIMLPQMFGPFEKPEVKAAFARALDYVTMIYARDPISYENLASNFDVGHKLKKAPDFTIGLKGQEAAPEQVAYLIPNSKVFAKPNIGGERYLQAIQTTWEALQSYGLRCRLLIFDTAAADQELLQTLLERLPLTDENTVVTETDPLRLKAMLGSARIIFSSRFHACVCGLSGHVPVLTYGWAYKYQALHDDFNVPELIIDEANPCEDISRKIKLLMTDGDAVRQKLTEAKISLTEQNHKMWENVFTTIETMRKTPR